MDNLYKELALLTDDEAQSCLNGLLKGLTIRTPEYAPLLKSPEEMKQVIREGLVEGAADIERVAEVAPEKSPKAIRLLLAEIAENEELSPRLSAWLEGNRPSLIEPVTTALVLAGIVLVLSTSVKVSYEQENGKKKVKVDVEKKATPTSLLKKFFGLFS